MKAFIKKTIIILLSALLLAGCGSKEKSALREYEEYSRPMCEMPEALATNEDFRNAWKCVALKATEGGGSYNGIPLLALTSKRMEEELRENGYSPTVKGYTLSVSNSDYLLEAKKNISDDKDHIKSIWLQYLQMDEEDFDSSIVNQLNEEASLGISKEIFGKTADELFIRLGINYEMMEWLLNRENASEYFYDQDQTFWAISYLQDSKTTSSGETKYSFALSLSYSALDVEERIYIGFDLDHVRTIEYSISETLPDEINRRTKDYEDWLEKEAINQ